MFPLSYQKTLRAHLNESQYLTLQLLLLLLQVHRQVKQFWILDCERKRGDYAEGS